MTKLPTGIGRLSALTVALCVLAGGGFLAPRALAQGTPGAGQPGAAMRMVVPNSDGVVMRCGSGAAWYPVATLNSKMLLRADTDVDGWLRVEYVAGMNVVVKADEAELNEREGKVRLTRRSRMRALSQADAAFEESYRPVFEEFLAPGIEMKYVGPIKTHKGEVGGYIVVPPPGAKGYVLARDVRDAKPEDLSSPGQMASQPVRPSAAQPSAPLSPAPTSGLPAEPATPVDSSLAPPVSTMPAPQESAPPTASSPGRVATIKQLDRSFDELMDKPLAESDPQELIEQYKRAGEQLSDNPASERTSRYIDTRIQLLELRQKARALMPEIQGLESAQTRAMENYKVTIDRLVANREYLVVGRLMPSTVYDGTRLPLMYRLISIDPSVNSTLAYIIPAEEHELEQKIGAVVGVLGDGKDEPSSMIRMITPTTVDVLRAADAPAPEVVR